MKVIGYIRVSTDEQANSGLGLEAQEARVRELEAERDELREQVEGLRDSLQHYKHLYDVLTYSREGGR